MWLKNSELNNAFQLNNIKRTVEFYETFLADEILNNTFRGSVFCKKCFDANKFENNKFICYFCALMKIVNIFTGNFLQLSETINLIMWPRANITEDLKITLDDLKSKK